MNDKYVFIDRDGVINKDPAGWTPYSYVTKWEDFHFLPGVLEALKKLSDAGYESVIISNQQGVGKGYMTLEDLNDITSKVSRAIKEAGGKVAGFYYCTHEKEENCSCRKPKDGLFRKAQKELGIKSFKGKFYLGDTQRDMEAGKRAGLKTILILSGKSDEEDAKEWEYKPDYTFKDLSSAADFILGEESE